MTFRGTPVLDERDEARILEALFALGPAFVPELTAAPGGGAFALHRIFSRYMKMTLDRLNQAPDKNLLAFLDMLGVSLIPAQAARAPVVFTPMPRPADGQIAARTRVGAKAPGGSQPIVFETDQTIAMAAARLVDVYSLWPARDAYASHAAEFASGAPFTLFDKLRPVPHELYLAHDILLNFGAGSTVEVEFELAARGSTALAVVWEFWDGQVWRPMRPFGAGAQPGDDGTAGFTRSGIATLRAECGKSAKTKVNGFDAFWVRARLDEPLPPDLTRTLATVDRVRLRSTMSRPLIKKGNACVGGIIPDKAFADTIAVDLTKIFYPMGKSPTPEATFYFTSDEAFGKPGAEITLCFERVKTPEEQADEFGTKFDIDVNAARQRLATLAQTAARLVATAAQSVLATVDANATDPTSALQTLTQFTGTIAGIDVDTIDTAAQDAGALATALSGLVNGSEPMESDPSFSNRMVNAGKAANDVADRIVELLGGLTQLGPAEGAAIGGIDINEVVDLLVDAGKLSVDAMQDVVEVARNLVRISNDMKKTDEAMQILKTSSAGLDLNKLDALPDLAASVAIEMDPLLYGIFFFTINLAQRVIDAAQQARNAVNAGKQILDVLAKFKPAPGASPPPPALDPARLVWEYWDGEVWQVLLPESSDPVRNLLATGEISFTIPATLAKTTVNGSNALWIRARLANGSYGRLRQVTWYDSQAKKINVFPIVEGRPPALAHLYLGYAFRSRWQFPERCLTYNDFQFADHGRDVRWPGAFFEPFSPVADKLPALYLGLDRPLPNDRVSTFFDVAETETETAELVWESWDGQTWRELQPGDETASLARPGMVTFIPPDVAPRPEITVNGSALQLAAQTQLEAGRFRPGDQAVISEGSGPGELASIEQINGPNILLSAPLARSYNNATLVRAALPRFGVSRDWVRARLKQDGAPTEVLVNGVYLNAAWASQLETVTDETLGAGNGQPNQTLFFHRTPVLPGEIIEVKELDGPRAEVEYPILREELVRQGFTGDDIRTVSEPRTGRLREVWVRWRNRPHLFFSGPGDRHYLIERARGRISFGDGSRGRLAAIGPGTIRARTYRAGGGTQANLPAGSITQLLSGAPAIAVTNPRAAEGGADAESIAQVRLRGPQTLRHRGRSLSALDYEALALEASPGVAIARVLPATSGNGRPQPGSVTVLIVPRSLDREPRPSFGLRTLVHAFLAERAPATLSPDRITVKGPVYLPVGVKTVIAAREAAESGTVEARVRQALETFLHPLTGGPEQSGWAFGRDVFLSDAAAIIESVPGVDYAKELELLVNDTPVGARVAVPPDRVVVAGPIRIEMTPSES